MSETYRETNLFNGISTEFKLELSVEGSTSEIKELFPVAVRSLPRYNFPILRARQEMIEEAFIHLDNDYSTSKKFLE
jgi:hypothetical protein